MNPSGSPWPQRSSAARSIPMINPAGSGPAAGIRTTVSVLIIRCQAVAPRAQAQNRSRRSRAAENAAMLSVEEAAILFREARLGCLHTEGHTEARAVPDIDEALLHDRVRQPVDDVIPPLRLAHRILERNIVLRQGGRQMHMRGQPDQPIEDPMGSDQ